ncbi:hypothetical protein HGRIS_009417 [Hohenbuehelia grisea]|uniref:Glutathione S-transferase n=1 Tax=Hohenbuehelia grisea TaxID=104357 RepID=A0ABR3J193_9AGAR
MTMSTSEAKESSSRVVIHHLNSSRSQRILWLLEELDVPYELRKYHRTSTNTAPKELLDISPLGKAPVITDGQVTLAESGAIIEYLLQKYDTEGRFSTRPWPESESGWLYDLYFTHYAEGSLQPILVRRYIFRSVPKRFPIFLRPLVGWTLGTFDKRMNQPDLEKHGKMIEDHLAKVNDWLADGEAPTRADFMMSFCLETLLSRAPDVVGPHVRAYVERIQQRPAYKRAVEKGGPYAYIVA